MPAAEPVSGLLGLSHPLSIESATLRHEKALQDMTWHGRGHGRAWAWAQRVVDLRNPRL